MKAIEIVVREVPGRGTVHQHEPADEGRIGAQPLPDPIEGRGLPKADTLPHRGLGALAPGWLRATADGQQQGHKTATQPARPRAVAVFEGQKADVKAATKRS